MKIAMASDHAGFSLKEEIKAYLQSQGHEVLDFGAHSEDACDLPDSVYPASLAVGEGKADRGIFVDGVGYGSAMIANKIYGVYAAVCQDPSVPILLVHTLIPMCCVSVAKLSAQRLRWKS